MYKLLLLSSLTLAVSCATISLQPGASFKPSRTYLYGKFYLTEDNYRSGSIQLVFERLDASDQEKGKYTTFDLTNAEASTYQVVELPPGMYRLLGYRLGIEFFTFKEDTPYYDLTFRAKEGHAYYIGDFFGYKKDISSIRYQLVLSRWLNNFEETTAILQDKYSTRRIRFKDLSQFKNEIADEAQAYPSTTANTAPKSGQEVFRVSETIEAENYGAVRSLKIDEHTKGKHLAFSMTGSWAEYSVEFDEPGSYTISMLASNGQTNGMQGLATFLLDGIAVAQIKIPTTDSWTTFVKQHSRSFTVSTVGKKTLRMEFTNAPFNVDSIVVTPSKN